MRRLNRWQAPRWIQLWALLATRAGDGWLWGAFGILLLLSGHRNRFAAMASAVFAGVTGTALQLAIKRAGGRTRPCQIEPHGWAKLLPPDQFSFPSGHSITAFAVCISLSLFYPYLLPGLLFCALSVAASRVLLGMHFLSDVIAGAAIGAGLAFGAAWIFKAL